MYIFAFITYYGKLIRYIWQNFRKIPLQIFICSMLPIKHFWLIYKGLCGYRGVHIYICLKVSVVLVIIIVILYCNVTLQHFCEFNNIIHCEYILAHIYQTRFFFIRQFSQSVHSRHAYLLLLCVRTVRLRTCLEQSRCLRMIVAALRENR